MKASNAILVFALLGSSVPLMAQASQDELGISYAEGLAQAQETGARIAEMATVDRLRQVIIITMRVPSDSDVALGSDWSRSQYKSIGQAHARAIAKLAGLFKATKFEAVQLRILDVLLLDAVETLSGKTAIDAATSLHGAERSAAVSTRLIQGLFDIAVQNGLYAEDAAAALARIGAAGSQASR